MFSGASPCLPSVREKIILLPKGNVNYRGVGLINVLWNTVLEVINLHIGAVITYHDVLHGFHVGRGTGTASLKNNLLQKMTEMR